MGNKWHAAFSASRGRCVESGKCPPVMSLELLLQVKLTLNELLNSFMVVSSGGRSVVFFVQFGSRVRLMLKSEC